MPDQEPENHICRAGPFEQRLDAQPTDDAVLAGLRQHIEPWLSAVFQSEHLSLLVGSGLSTALSLRAGGKPADMSPAGDFKYPYAKEVMSRAKSAAKAAGRGRANIEDQIRATLELMDGLRIIDAKGYEVWQQALQGILWDFLAAILACERTIADYKRSKTDTESSPHDLLASFLMSFASRAPSRDRLNVFTTNYDRIIEFGADLAGLRVLDRFTGALSPRFRSSRVELDLHYNPPGIRGEPRYFEGVVRLTKLHGSVDWRYDDGGVRRVGVSFGEDVSTAPSFADIGDSLLIYPNPAKDVETLLYPYADLFRDFAAAICRPNSSMITYGYGFGDDHINRIIRDMLTIPSTHLVIISYGDPDGRIESFLASVGKDAQISLLLGPHFGDLEALVKWYLPKPAIDQITIRVARIQERRGHKPVSGLSADTDDPVREGGE